MLLNSSALATTVNFQEVDVSPTGRLAPESGAKEIAMAHLRDMTFETRMRHIRSSGRLNSRVAVAVEWADAGGSLRAEGYTVDIAPKGCLAVIPQCFTVGQRLRLINLLNQISCEAVLVWRGHEGRKGWELGLELQEPTADFWGLDF
jgi:hypothetical protein